MSRIHSKSGAYNSAQTDYFSLPYTQDKVEKTWVEEHYPKNSLSGDNMPMEFSVAGGGDTFIDLSKTMLMLEVEIRHKHGTPIHSKIIPLACPCGCGHAVTNSPTASAGSGAGSSNGSGGAVAPSSNGAGGAAASSNTPVSAEGEENSEEGGVTNKRVGRSYDAEEYEAYQRGKKRPHKDGEEEDEYGPAKRARSYEDEAREEYISFQRRKRSYDNDEEEDEYAPTTAKRVKRSNETGGPDNVGPTNNFMHTLIDNIEIKLNGNQVNPSAHNYSQSAHIETRCGYNPHAKGSHLQSQLYFEDTPGFENDINGRNRGYAQRKQFSDNSNTFELYGPLYCDLFGIDRYLINEVTLDIKITRNRAEYCLMGDKNAYMVVIKKAVLMITRHQMSASELKETHEKLKTQPAVYPHDRKEFKIFKISGEEVHKVADYLSIGKQPKRAIIGFVDEAAYNGAIDKNPLKYENIGLKRLVIHSGGQQFPATPLTMDFNNPAANVMSYASMFSGSGIHYGDEGNGISRLDFNKCPLWIFDLSQDHSAASGTHWNPIRLGNLRVEATLERALNRCVVGMVYLEYDALLQIDMHRKASIST
jgi:hypothetical protein